MQTFSLAPQIKFGENSLEELAKLSSKKVLIVTDALMVQFGIAQKVTDVLSNHKIAYTIFDRVEPNPSLETVQEILKLFLNFAPDTVIGLGGGSPIDAAKGALYFADRLSQQFSAIAVAVKPYFIAIPTTSGTGSEVTSYAVLTDKIKQSKIALSDPSMLPNLAILDPIFTSTLPKSVIADTGMDVLTHATEALASNVSSAYTDALAMEAITAVFKHLIANYEDSKLSIHREAMQNASCMAGIAFNNSSLGINHSLAHAIGGRFHISHGKINAILLPYVVAFNGMGELANSKAIKAYTQISRSLGLPSRTDVEAVSSFKVALEVLKETLGISKDLMSYGIEENLYLNAINELAEQAYEDMCTEHNPVKVTKQDLIKVLKAVYYGN